jgi:acyl-CoA thioester hydrolase|tara:strand:+ start:216 stop:623 length:408 start_codon:yes stop_codon:yes gene_type:complete
MRTLIDVRFHEVDSQGHANHTAIVAWIAHCRVKLLGGLVAQSGCEDIDHVLVGLSMNFREEVYYPDKVVVEGEVTEVGTKSVGTAFHVCREQDEIANAVCTNVFFDLESGGSIEIPEDLKNLLTSASRERTMSRS